ncbi:MAG: hypothetical protein IJ846_06535 [Alphaproteobacteria bacterium]|nr:hypothetical protein [Alphaproteobacteria bacterium]
MTKRFAFKRLCGGLAVAIGSFFILSRPVMAGLFDKDMSEVCGSWENALSDYSGTEHCWACQIFMLVFDACNQVAGQINSALSGPLSSLVVAGCGLWIAFETASFFGSFGNRETAEYLTKLGGILLKVLFALLFLKGGAAMAFTYIVNPVLTAGARLATNVIAMTNSGLNVSMGDISGSMSSGPMGAGVRGALNQMIESISSSMAQSQAIAHGLRCGAWFWKEIEISLIIFSIKFHIFNPVMFQIGAVLGCMFWAIAILFSFAVLDVIFRIGMLVGMMPVFIAAWVFPKTASFADTAWSVFLHSTLVFFITGLLASAINILVEKSWNVAGDNTNNFMAKMQSGDYVEAWDSLFDSGIGGALGSIFLVHCVVVWCWFMAPKADELAGKFAEGGFTSNCALKAIKMILGFIMDLIMFIITIVTLGVASCMYSIKVGKMFADNAEKAYEIADKIEKRLQKIKKEMERLQKVAQSMDNT